MGDGAHVRLVAVLHVAVHHVEVALVDRQIDGLADGATGVMERVRHVGELDEIAEVLDASVAAPLIEAAHERRAVRGREYRAIAADHHVAGGGARVLREFPRRGAPHDGAAHAARETHALALDVGAGVLPQLQRLCVVAEVDADLLEDGVGVVLEQLESLVAEHLVVGNLSRYVGNEGMAASGARSNLGIASAGTPGAHRLTRWLLFHGPILHDVKPIIVSTPRRNWPVCGMDFSGSATAPARCDAAAPAPAASLRADDR